MNILLIALGSAGDVHPFVGLGLALRARGRQVTLATNPFFESLVRDAGLEFLPVGTADQLRLVMKNPDLWHPSRGLRLIVGELMTAQLRPIYDLVKAYYVPGETVVAGQCTALGARLAQEKLGVPLATVHLQPAVFRSVYRSPVLRPLVLNAWVPKPLKRFQFWAADRLLVDRLINRGLTPFRSELGLPPITRIMNGWWNSPQKVIGLFPPWYAPRQPDWPPQVVMTGFPLWDERGHAPEPAELESFLAEGDPPIVFTPGSAMLHGQQFFETAAAACQILRRRGILLTRYPEQLPAALPDGVRHFDFVPLSTLLPRAAAIVHHGGIGTLAQGLAAGIPQVTMPMAHDQPDNAQRLRRLGVGRTLTPRQFSPLRVAEALYKLIGAPRVAERCRHWASTFDTPAALAATCEEIESLSGTEAVGGTPHARATSRDSAQLRG